MTESARLVITVDSTQAAKAGADLSALERQAAKTEIGITELAKSAAKAYGALKLGGVVTEVATLAARYDQLGLVMNTVAANTDRSTVEIAALDGELRKVGISAIQSRNNIIKMMSANIDLAQASKLARLAQDAAVVGNTNSSEAFERLVKGIQSAEKETLETLGLNVNFQQSYEKLAAQLGKNAEQLTTAEKTQAGVNAAMEAGKNIAGAYEASLDNAGKKLQSSTRYLEDLKVSLGAAAQPAFGLAVDGYVNSLKFLNENVGAVTQALETGLYMAFGRIAASVGTSVAAFARDAAAKQAAAAATLALAETEAVEAASNLRATQARYAAYASHVAIEAAAKRSSVAQLELAAAQKAASLSSVAAAGAGSRLLGLLGGPWGIALTVGATALSFLDFGDKAKTGMGTAASATEQAATRIRNATRNMLPGNLESLPYADIQARLADVGGQLDKAKKELDGFQKSFDAGSISKQWLTEPKERVAALEAAYQKLQEQANGARFSSDKAGSTYVESLGRQAALVGKVTEVEKLRANVQAGFIKLSDADLQAAELKAAAIDKANESMRAGSQLEKESVKDAKAKAAALEDLLSKTAISINSTNAMADAYLAGADSVRELAIQQKIEEELLKTGAGARDAVTAAVNREADAKDRLDIDQSIANMRAETTNTLAQATATLQGADALETFNIQKSMSIALSGKKIEYGSKEYAQLLDQTKAQLAANKALEQANSIEGIVDRLNPQVKLLRDYTKEQEALNAAIASGTGDTALYQDTLAKLALEYEQNKNAATAWGRFTEGAVDRVDSAFADAWKNIDDGFSGFATSLKEGFKQLLAELAHMAITKPIIMQIGASLGVGGLSAQSSGLFGGSSGGGSSLDTMFSAGKSIYSAATSGFGSAVSAGWSAGEGFLGGMQGAISNGASYISSGLSGLFGSGGVSAASSMAAGASQAGYTGAAMSSWTAGQNAAASATSYGPGLSAISGAIMGYQNSGFKGAAAGAAGGYAGAQAGATVGTYFGPIGTAVGAVIGGMLGAIGGSKLFGGDWQTKDQGFSLGVENGDFAGQQFEYQKKKGGLFGKNKKRTRLSALDPQMQAALDATYDATEGSVLTLFDRLNVQLNDGVLDGLNVAATQISTKDKAAEQIQEEITKWFGGVADSMVSAVDAATGAGLGGFNFESLTTFVNNLYGVNEAIRYLNVGMFDLSVSGGKMAEQLSAMAGGLDALKASNTTYYDNFYSDAEKADDSLDAVSRQFKALNIALPETREGYRSMVEALDLTTEAGRAMFVTLTGMAGNAASAYSILEQRSDAAAAAVQAMSEKLIGVAGGAQSALQRAISAQQKTTTEAYNDRITSLNEMVSTATENVSGLTSVGNDLGAALKALRGDSDDAVKMLRAQAQATLQSALATARSGGSLSGFTGLSDALDTVSGNNTDLYGSMEDFARDQGRTANVVAELNGINGKQLSAAEKSLKGLEDQIKQAKDSYDLQMAQYDQQLEFAQAQMDALNGIDNSIKSVADAISAMNMAVISALAGMGGKGATNSANTNGAYIDTIYNELLGREADKDGKDYWLGQVAKGDITLDQLAQAIANAAVKNSAESAASQAGAGKFLGLPGYATGGLISGPGTGTSDSIFARLSNGEYVMSADAVRMFGTGLLDQMNAGLLPAFALGGGVGEAGPQLEVTGPSRIYSASQTGSMSKGGSDNAQLERKVDVLIDVVKQIVGPMKLNSDADSKLFKKWDRVGLPTTVVKEPA